MLIANNRLPRRINGNSQEVEKLEVGGVTYFDATTTIPVESIMTYNETAHADTASLDTNRTFGDVLIENIPETTIENIDFYKDVDGYSYLIDIELNTIVKFKGKIEKSGWVFNNETNTITQPAFKPDRADSIYGVYSFNFSNYSYSATKTYRAPYLFFTNTIQNLTFGTVEQITYGDITSKYVSRFEKTNEVQYNCLLTNKGTKNYTLNAYLNYFAVKYFPLSSSNTLRTTCISNSLPISYKASIQQYFLDGTK